MFDAAIRPWINPTLDAAGCWLSMRGLTEDRVTVVGFGIGLGAAVSIALGHFGLGVVLILVSRLADGLDGAVA
jgi:phosphatidylglycerophosphate synthase